jgi:predicted P-loop ATPase
VVRYRKGEHWWLDTPELISAAETEQSARYDDDPWMGPIALWIDGQEDTSVSDILTGAVRKNVKDWAQPDMNRVARILTRLKWERYRKRSGGDLEWRYRPKKDRPLESGA